ncbi:MAG: hypothetical protein RBS16_01935 [Candidatus Cloacimonadales bacterium]|jgi:hypothetical protein|nr:hypothetical protein [Candidatus Cloacimonadales bacterium]
MLKLELKLDISNLLQNLDKSESKIKEVLGKLEQPLKIQADKAQADMTISELESNVAKIENIKITLSADADNLSATTNDAISEINSIPDTKDTTLGANNENANNKLDDTKEKVEQIPDQKEINISANTESAINKLAMLGLALNTVKQAYSMLSSSVAEFITYSNIQEQAENDLISALNTRGQATEKNIKAYKDMASAIQNITTVGDEQSLKLITMSVNMGIAEEKRQEATKGAIGLAKAFESAGLSQETAMKGIALAYEGEFAQLSRYIPALRSAQSETEQMAILQENMANGFQMAQDETNTGAGAITQYNNLVGDLKEKIGDLVKDAILPVVKGLSSFASLLNDHPAIFKTATAAIGTIIVALSAWKVAQIALNLTMAMNPIGLIVTAIGALVAGVIVAINHIGGFAVAWEYVKASLLIVWEYLKAFGSAWAGMFDIIWESVKNLGKMLKALFTGDFSAFIDLAINGFKSAFDKTMDHFAQAGQKAKQIWNDVEKSTRKTPTITQKTIITETKETIIENTNNDENNEDYEDPIIKAYEKELELLSLKKQNGYEVTEQLKQTYTDYMQYLKELYGKDSVEYQQVLNQKINFERDRSLKLANLERERLAEQRAMEQTQWEFEQQRLLLEDPQQARLEQQLRNLEQFYETKTELLIKQGYTEQQITAQKEKAIQSLERDSMFNRLKYSADGLGAMANNLAQLGGTGFKISKALQRAQVLLETPAAAMSAYRSVVGIPVIGPTLAPIAFATAIAVGGQQLQAIDKAIPPKAQYGGLTGLLKGPSHQQGGIIIEAEGDEYIINKNRVKELGTGFFDFINYSPIQNIKESFKALKPPNLPPVPTPSYSFASGGRINAYNQSPSTHDKGPVFLKLNETVEELKQLKQTLIDKNLTVHNHISANEIINKADPVTINKQAEKGEIIRSRW